MRGTPYVPHSSVPDSSHAGGRRLSNFKRFLISTVICVVVIGVLAGIKVAQISALIQSGKAAQAAGPPPQAVGTDVAKAAEWQSVLDAVGSVAAARGVTISNESPGVVKAIKFQSGQKVRAGQVLVELDAAVERAQLASLKARLGLATTNAQRARMLTEKGAVTRVQLDADEAQLKTATADVAALEAQIERKIVRAPFAGKLGIRSINLGQYLNPGTPITALESTEAVWVDFTIPQQDLARVPVGAATRIVLPGKQAQTLEGKVAATEPNADPATRSVKLRASVNDEKAQLRPGMFVNVSIILPEQAKVVSVPATAIARAPYGDSVFVVEDRKDEKGAPVKGPDGKPGKVARQQFVRVGQARGDFVAILDGLTAGQEVVTEGGFKLRNGAPIMINNRVKLEHSQNPRPENH